MSNLTDFFPAGSSFDVEKDYWGPSGKPDYLLTILAIGGGSGYSSQICGNACACFATNTPGCSCEYGVGGTGGGIFYGSTVAGYSGVSVPITIGAAGANGSPTSCGLPGGKGGPGGPSTFGCITAYGGGAPATVGPTAVIPADPGGVGGWGYGHYQDYPDNWWPGSHYGGRTRGMHAEGTSINFQNHLGTHIGHSWQGYAAMSVFARSPNNCINAPYDPRYPGPRPSPCPSFQYMPNFYCLDLDGRGYNCNDPLLGQKGFDCWTQTRFDLRIAQTRCLNCRKTPTGCNPTSWAGQCAPIYSLPAQPNTGMGGDIFNNATAGVIWIVYPTDYPAASIGPSPTVSVDCTPCVQSGYRAYKFTSPGTFTLS